MTQNDVRVPLLDVALSALRLSRSENHEAASAGRTILNSVNEAFEILDEGLPSIVHFAEKKYHA